MKFSCHLILSILLLSSCGDTGIEPIDNYILLHDNSSKVWLIDKQLDGDKDYTPLQFEYKDLIVFHESQNAYFHRLKDLGTKPGIKMGFWLDQSKNEIGFKGTKKDLIFEIISLTRTKIVLKPKHKSFKYTIVLIPFPEY
ncbi:hypothetical protein [Fluviicola taffensis]|uniref:Lipoprotein n=1 Tax=Fluviicola taffensis (strain DSM 16823 / NCIMB 13979 / RW262) TaxID=755732 RepID=F2IBP6_FLUTR|nr:hypothetical protein [Fluviicola taffensis]AEA45372.1 hypothetical protein Fluta_3400 [Fluviicola taffensis DSM 16823]